jgi:hypothetical protein
MNFIDMIIILKKFSDTRGARGILPLSEGSNIELQLDLWGNTLYQRSKYTSKPLSFPALKADQILSNNWEILFVKEEKPKLHTFEQAIAALKEGKTIKRQKWTMRTIERDFCDYCFTDDYFTIDDFEANDWIIIGG